MSLEHHYIESFVARLAAREKQIQQNFRPVISVHKWFARRPGTLFRALLLAEFGGRRLEGAYAKSHVIDGVCLDPMMGGGTPLLEAARLGLSVVGNDTNPMAAWVVERELEDLDPPEFAAAGERVAADVERKLAKLYRTRCPDCRALAPVRYFFWVRQHRCACGIEHPLLHHTQLVSTSLGRHPREVHICSTCLAFAEHPAGQRPRVCPHCARDYDASLVAPDSEHTCPCDRPYRIPPQGSIETPSARLVGVEYDCACSATRHAYKSADAEDRRRLRQAENLAAREPSPHWPDELIPRGEETGRLLRWGFNQWRDLHNPRQLHALGVLATRIQAEPDSPVRRALATCFSDILRFQNMLCRYDRQALKPTDAFAVHGFPVPRIICEPALVGVRGVGSGGFRHALAKYERAKAWCRAPYETLPEGKTLRRVPTSGERIAPALVEDAAELAAGGAALLTRASLDTRPLPESSVDLVLTDPPYLASVQYGQLMDFLYAWLRRLEASRHFDTPRAQTDEDAVGSTSVDLAEFTRRLSGVYTAAAAALKPGGAFAFTFHHNDVAAYAPLIVACLDAGLIPTRLYACPGEMRASRHIHDRHASTVDAVFILRKPPVEMVSARAFAHPGRVVAARVAALERAGLRVSAADRTCLRSAALAMRAMARLAGHWRQQAPLAERLAAADAALRGESLITA